MVKVDKVPWNPKGHPHCKIDDKSTESDDFLRDNLQNKSEFTTIQWNSEGCPLQNRCNLNNCQWNLSGWPLQRDENVKKISEILRGTPCKIGETYMNIEETQRGTPCKVIENLLKKQRIFFLKPRLKKLRLELSSVPLPTRAYWGGYTKSRPIGLAYPINPQRES